MSRNHVKRRILLFCAAAVTVSGITLGIIPSPQTNASAALSKTSGAPHFETGAKIAQSSNTSPGGGLPGGASSLRESYQDWQVICSAPNGTSQCVLSQQQADPNSRQRVLSIELQAAGSAASGVLLLPFGLQLEAGAALSVDDRPDVSKFSFRTCLPAGCMVAFNLDTKTVETMRSATTLNIMVTPTSDAEPITFSVSLKGFPQAFDRLLALGETKSPT